MDHRQETSYHRPSASVAATNVHTATYATTAVPASTASRRIQATISRPEPLDIVCGRGKSMDRPGNERFQSLVHAHKEAYQSATRRDEKSRITQLIVDELRLGSSRFLLQDESSSLWYNASDTYAREKVSHALRSRPYQERKRSRPEKAKTSRKSPVTPEIQDAVKELLIEQRKLFDLMVEHQMSYAPTRTEIP